MKKKIDETELCQLIRQLRIEKRLTQREIAKRMGISRSMYAQMERGYTSCIPYLDELARHLGGEVLSVFNFNAEYYTNRRLFLYALLHGASYPELANQFAIKTWQLKNILFSSRKIYLLQYKSDFDMLFPRMREIALDTEYYFIGENSVSVRARGKEFIFLNVLDEKKDTDNFMKLKK